MLARWFYRFYGRIPLQMRYVLVRIVKPKYTVGTIPFVFRADGRVLLVRHSYGNDWATPGGFVNRREHALDAARREVLEEVGLVVRVVGEPAVVIEPATQRVELVIRMALADESAAVDARPRSPEIVETGWFDPGEFPNLQAETIQAWAALVRLTLPPG